jgi:hypothetical protein
MLRGKVLASIGLAGAGVCAALLMAAVPAQARVIVNVKETKYCEAQINSKEIKGKLTVRPGADCRLVGDSVDGDVSIGEGARLLTLGTGIKGNVSGKVAESVFLLGSEVDGDVSIDGTSGTKVAGFFCPVNGLGIISVCMKDDRVGGNVSITNTSPLGALIAKNLVGEDLTCTGNAAVTNLGEANTVLGQEFGQCVGL